MCWPRSACCDACGPFDMPWAWQDHGVTVALPWQCWLWDCEIYETWSANACCTCPPQWSYKSSCDHGEHQLQHSIKQGNAAQSTVAQESLENSREVRTQYYNQKLSSTSLHGMFVLPSCWTCIQIPFMACIHAHLKSAPCCLLNHCWKETNTCSVILTVLHCMMSRLSWGTCIYSRRSVVQCKVCTMTPSIQCHARQQWGGVIRSWYRTLY